MSDRNAVFLVASIAMSLGYDVSTIVLNKDSIRNSRKVIRALKKNEFIESTSKPNSSLGFEAAS